MSAVPPSPNQGKFNPSLPLALLAAAIAFAAMQPVTGSGFVEWDETAYIIDNPLIRHLSFKNIAAIFSTLDLSLYSPLSTLSFAFDYAIGGLNPAVYHWHNLILHCLNASLTLLLALRLGFAAPAAFLLAALFGAHPLHVESVAWAAERKDVLYAFFFLASLYSYTVYEEKRTRTPYYAALCAFILSVLAKPMGVTLPLILVLLDWYNRREDRRRAILEKIPFFAVAALFAFYILSLPKDPRLTVLYSVESRAMAPLYNIGFYVVKAFWPADLCAAYTQPDGGALGLWLYAAAGLLLITIAVICRRNRLLMAGTLFYLITLLPVMQLFPFGPVISADRYSYMPLLGIFAVIAAVFAGIAAGEKYRVTAWSVCGAVILSLIMTARARAGVWKDGVTLWSDTSSKQPSTMAFHALGNSLSAIGQNSEAVENYTKALALNPKYAKALVNRGTALIKMKMYADGMADYERAIRLNPGYEQTYANMASAYYEQKNFQKAAEWIQRAVYLRPDSDTLWSAAGIFFASANETEQAEYYFSKALQINPNNGEAYYSLCLISRRKHSLPQARVYCNRAMALGYPVSPHIIALLGAGE